MSYTNLPQRSSRVPRSSQSDSPVRSSLPASADPSSRRSSRVHFDDTRQILPTSTSTFPQNPDLPRAPAPAPSRASDQVNTSDWQFPVYQNDYSLNAAPPRRGSEIAPNARGGRSSFLQVNAPAGDDRRGSGESDATLNDYRRRLSDDEHAKYSFSSYQHPYDINAPPDVYAGDQSSHRSRQRRSVSFAGVDSDNDEKQHDDDDYEEEEGDAEYNLGSRDNKRRGFLSNLIDLYGVERGGLDDSNKKGTSTGRRQPGVEAAISSRPWNLRRADSMASNGSQVLDADDPLITGERKENLDDPDDIERELLRQMDYRARRKARSRVRIEFNITSILNRQRFLTRLAKALMTFGAPSHRIESQLISAARILEVDAEFIHIPGVIICSFGDPDTKTSETHFIKCGGRLSLGSLHDVHQVYRTVVHDEISAKKATAQLDGLLEAKPIYGSIVRCALAFTLSALICPLAFGGSFADMWISGLGAAFLCLMQLGVMSKSQLYANVFEITMTILISFLARGLSSIRSQIFCYTAISSAGIVGILPGYLILTSSLELASKNIVCGSVKMVYALIYTLFLGFGLQIGSDFYLLFDQSARTELNSLAARLSTAVHISGTFASDSGGFAHVNDGNPLSGTFTFTNSTPLIQHDIVTGCYRPPAFAWYLQPFPWWTQFIIVPIFSILSSLANLQPLFTRELIVMVVISCVSYAANKIANIFIFNRSDVVSAIGAFACGLFGNIYSRRMGGTAFTSMVTGVLFLVPSGLSQAGGITAQGNGIDIGGAMIAVTIGITVGLFMSQALVYMFGSRKNAAIFSF